jgi:outer membrane protein assembly factor BamA
VPEGKSLLVKNEVKVNGENENGDETLNLLYQKPNSSILGFRLRLQMYNLAAQNPDSSYRARFVKDPEKYERWAKLLSKKQVDRLGRSFLNYGIHNFLKRTGEAPIIIDTLSTRRSLARLNSYYFNNGYFRSRSSYSVDSVGNKKAKINYTVTTGQAYILDSLTQQISTPVLDSLYATSKAATLLKSGKQYKTADFNAEKERITTYFRNRGIYHFQQNYVKFDIDTVDTNYKANSNMIIGELSYREGDSTKTVPFKMYRISEVNIFTDSPSSKAKTVITDSITYNNFNLYSSTKLKYRPKALTDAVFITKGALFADFRTTLTSRYLSNLRVFNYPSIQYMVDTRDTTANSLIANIYLTPRKKFTFAAGLDFTHSNIQDFGIGGTTSVAVRNIFNGAETLEVAARGNIGSSYYFANPNQTFFNVSEYGVDIKLLFPRIFAPFNTEKIIPKNMIPSTSFNLGYAKQQNIGLDKENFTSSLSYVWNPKRFYNARLDLFNIQFVRNLNPQNYFRVYGSSYNALNDIARNYPVNPEDLDGENLDAETGTIGFIDDVQSGAITATDADLQTINSIEERRRRLTENNLIFASSYSYSKTTKTDLQDNTFYAFKARIESAGNFLSLLARVSRQLENQDGNNTILNVEYSQYIKTEIEYIKHWDLTSRRVLAMRAFAGIALPYGNSDDVPFSRSYFAGGSNDNRAWQPYGLGPGRSGGVDDYNEANMKLAFNTELRFHMFGDLHGAIFSDIGNIWNVLDSETDPDKTFTGLSSLRDIAVGSGFGLRYDFNFFVVRLDLGFKTYNPADEPENRWFRDYNFANSVLNIGINYPF